MTRTESSDVAQPIKRLAKTVLQQTIASSATRFQRLEADESAVEDSDRESEHVMYDMCRRANTCSLLAAAVQLGGVEGWNERASQVEVRVGHDVITRVKVGVGTSCKEARGAARHDFRAVRLQRVTLHDYGHQMCHSKNTIKQKI